MDHDPVYDLPPQPEKPQRCDESGRDKVWTLVLICGATIVSQDKRYSIR